ncbi:hypothetical protein [Amycolatopsis vastitatis]|uniref:hypothetical protein n=1 Tax=Amycolatopsis vastitatis TaxID=1905142 RepID=UPI0026D2B4F7
MRSRGLTAGTVRLTLDSALVRRGEWAPAVPEPQHVAFACTDAVAAARAMRAMEAPLLEIPGNYYDDRGFGVVNAPVRMAAHRARRHAGPPVKTPA